MKLVIDSKSDKFKFYIIGNLSVEIEIICTKLFQVLQKKILTRRPTAAEKFVTMKLKKNK